MGFLNEKINNVIQRDAFEQISEYVIAACENVRQSHVENGNSLDNDENKIRSVLFNEFLEVDDIRSEFGMSNFLFEPESLENYDCATGNYIGRTDIKVLLQSEMLMKVLRDLLQKIFVEPIANISGEIPLKKIAEQYQVDASSVRG